MADRMFPELPQELGALSADELTEHLSSFQEVARKVGDRDPEVIGDRTMKTVLDEYQAAVEEIERIRDELKARDEADSTFDASLKELNEKAGLEAEVKAEDKAEDAPDDPSVPEDEPAEPEKVEVEVEVKVEADTPAAPAVETPEAPEAVEETTEVPEPVAASAALERRPSLPQVKKDKQPVVTNQGAPLVASAGIPGIGEAVVLDGEGLAKAMIAKRYQGSAMPPGFEEKVLIATANYGEQFPEDRWLRGNADDQAKILNVTGEEALTASGGLCAPVTPYYELANVSVADRPVRDSLAGFAAVRGGLRFAATPSLAAIDDAVGIKTAAEDAVGGTTATKTCQIVECPDFDEVQLAMIYKCLQFGNLNSRAWPEMVTHFNDLASAAHARLAETALLDGIQAASSPVTTSKVLGSTWDLIYAISRAAAGMRSRHRMAANSRFRAIMPAWVADHLAVDLAGQAFGRFDFAREAIGGLLGRYGVNITWTLDGSTTGGQVFDAQAALTTLDDFPDTVEWFIFPEGSYLFLDGGTLDLGIVRDSTLNSTNDFQVFAETFEEIAFIGVQSLQVRSVVCPTGQVAAAATALSCT